MRPPGEYMCVHTCVCWRGASKREELVTFYYRSRVSPFVIPASHTALQENFSWEFLGVPMIRTQRFHQGCPDSVPGGETKLLYGMAKNTKKENFLCLFPSTVLFQEPFTVVSVTWSLGNWGGGGNSEVRLLSHSLTTLCLLTDFCVCIVSQSPPHSLPWPLHGWVQWYTLYHLIHPRTPLVLIDSTIIACYLQGISSRTPEIPKSMDAQVSYIKCCSAAGAPSPWVPQLWIQRAD